MYCDGRLLFCDHIFNGYGSARKDMMLYLYFFIMQMYCDGRLLFCDHIFNGYGSARKDFKKQVMKSRHDAIYGCFLPKDFKFR